MDLNKLKEPFPAEEIEWRLQQCGEKNGKIWAKCLAYVTNRAICNRLDDVCGAENWKNEFTKAPDGGVLCGISVKVGGEWVTKYDGAENTDIEGVKGGLSGSMKRAASTGWGIGRYLYNLDEGWADISESGKFSGKTKEGKWFRWNPPALPHWALPNGSGKPQMSGQKQKPQQSDNNTQTGARSQAQSGSQPQYPETDEAKRLKDALIDYINSGVIKENDGTQTYYWAQTYMRGNDINGMKSLLAWCKQQPQSA